VTPNEDEYEKSVQFPVHHNNYWLTNTNSNLSLGTHECANWYTDLAIPCFKMGRAGPSPDSTRLQNYTTKLKITTNWMTVKTTLENQTKSGTN